jgi:hypothetical protein
MFRRSPRLALAACLVLGFVALPATAQIAVGVEVGTTLATLDGEDVDRGEVDRTAGFYVGGAVGVPLGGRFSLGAGLYFAEKGADAGRGGRGVDLDYLEIPLAVHFSLTRPGSRLGATVFGGLGLGVLLTCDGGGVCDEDLEDFDAGYLYGASLTWALSERAAVAARVGVEESFGSACDCRLDFGNDAIYAGVGLIFLVGGG